MFRRLTIATLLGLILAGCGANPQPTALPTAMPNELSKQTPGSQPPAGALQVVMIQSTLPVGPNRFAIGILDGDTFVKNARLTFTFYDLTQGAQKEVGTVPAIYREGPDGLTGIYTAETTFLTAGSWGARISGTTADGKTVDQAIGFDVLPSSKELGVGQRAPLVKSPTLDDVHGDLKLVSSATTPNPDFYKLSLDQAIKSGKPTVVSFSTPAFCASRLCGPAYEALAQVYPDFKDKLNFIHVEVYKGLPNPDLSHPQLADAMGAWGLSSDPWTYLLDSNGVVVWRVNGLVTADEIKTQIDKLLKSS